MTTNPKPSNQPDPGDMWGGFKKDGDASEPTTAQPNLEEEEEAERLGDFA